MPTVKHKNAICQINMPACTRDAALKHHLFQRHFLLEKMVSHQTMSILM